MAVTIKTHREIDLMRESCKILAKVHEELGQAIKPGISTLYIDQLGEKLIRDMGCVPNFLHYNGYPASICVSVNDEVVHGIPRADRILQEGDIVSLDCGLIYKGYHSDAARTHGVGQIRAFLILQKLQPPDNNIKRQKHHKIVGCRRYHLIKQVKQIVNADDSCKIR